MEDRQERVAEYLQQRKEAAILLVIGKGAEAAAILRESARLAHQAGDEDFALLGEAAVLAGLEKEFSRAAALADQAIEWSVDRASPELYQMLTFRASVKLQTGNFDAAIADAERALSIKPDDDKALRVRGILYLYKNDSPQALAFLQRAREIEFAQS